MSSIGPQPNAPAPQPPPGWPVMPPPKQSGLPTWAIVLIVLVVVAVVAIVTIFLAAFLFLLMTPLEPPNSTLPSIAFGPAEAVTNGFEFPVAGVTQSHAAPNYRVALSTNGTAVGTARTLAASITFGQYTITWTDVGGEGDLTGGDVFRVTRAGGLPGDTEFIVTFLWSNGSAVGLRDYSS